jgi:Predicted membrane protein
MVVGISRGILIVMQSGNIVDTIVHWLASAVGFLPGGLAAVGMFLVQTCINLFIPSGSGQAATTMPIMTPLADMLEITRQTAVMAFHYGDGFTNQIIPTSGALMAVLAVAKVPYEKWVKFIWPVMVMWTIVGSIMCFISATIKLGPF